MTEKLVLYGTVSCHLCEQAEAVLAQVALINAVTVTRVDIANDDMLIDSLGEKIPVVEFANQEQLSWPFGVMDVMAKL